jgi:hypothetical protein
VEIDLVMVGPFLLAKRFLDGALATRRVLNRLPHSLLLAFLDILVPPDHSSSYLLEPDMSSSFNSKFTPRTPPVFFLFSCYPCIPQLPTWLPQVILPFICQPSPTLQLTVTPFSPSFKLLAHPPLLSNRPPWILSHHSISLLTITP